VPTPPPPTSDIASSAENPSRTPVLLRDRAFSFPSICAMVAVLFIFGLCLHSLPEPDFWWHLRNGQQIVQFHTIPKFDTYTFGAAGAPWLDHEWLSEVCLFLAFKLWALRGVFALYFALAAAIYAVTFCVSLTASADSISTLLVTIVAVMLGSISFGPRPLLFGWLCMAVVLLVLERFHHGKSGIWILPPLFALWVNFHGSWVFGIVVFGATIVSGLIEGDWGLIATSRWTHRQLNTLLLVFATSIAALFVNPFGYRLPLYPFDLLLRQPSNMKFVEEWQSVNFGKGSGKVALVALLALLVTSLFSGRRWRLDQVLIAVFGIWMGLSHVRLLFFLGLVMTPILATRLNLFPPVGPQRNRPVINAVIIAVMVGWIVFSLPSESALQKDVNDKFPTAALDYMQRQHITGRVFNEDWFGGYMEWTAPGIKPFTDSRADIFVYNGTFDDYVRAVRIVKPFEVLDKYHIGYVLIGPDSPLVYVLKRSPNWRVLYSDNVAVLLGRSE